MPQSSQTTNVSSFHTSQTQRRLALLKSALLTGTSHTLEKLAADLIAVLTGARVAVAEAGFQFGADGGTTGSQDVEIRFESKRYADGTPLNKRELQGEVDDALRRNPQLDAWILVTTRPAAEGLRETLNAKSEEEGLPIPVIDWDEEHGDLPELAALCAMAPELVERHYGKRASRASRALRANAGPTIERIRRDLQPWHVGYEALRYVARSRIESIWNSIAASKAIFGQNAAGEASDGLLARTAVLEQFNTWWGHNQPRPVVVHGAEGVGKTWAVMHWITTQIDGLPIVLTIPSSAVPRINGVSETTLLEFLGAEIFSLTETRSRGYWEKRVRRLLRRPDGEGPAFLLVFDGVNQEPSVAWGRLLQVLHGEKFSGAARVLLTSQTHFLENRLNGLKSLTGSPFKIGIEPYDDTAGGELDQLLGLHGIARSELSDQVVRLARTPRMFPLVVKFRREAALRGDVTVNRLLWAYGCDELGVREQRGFSESEWAQWLVNLAEGYSVAIASQQDANLRGNIGRPYSVSQLSGSASLSYLNPDDNYRRLSEIISGTWMEEVPGMPGNFRPRDSTILLALGAALLSRLEAADAGGSDVPDALSAWLDPIAATSAAADILAATASILVAKGAAGYGNISPAVLVALLQSQNAREEHRQDVVNLAPAIGLPLVSVIERSILPAQASARKWATDALRCIPFSNAEVWLQVYERIVHWVAHAPCPSPAEKARADGSSESLSLRLIKQIGTDEPGVHATIGVPIRLHPWESYDLANAVPTLLQGHSLLPAIKVLAAACVAHAVGHSGTDAWDGMRWLVLLNQVDRLQVVDTLLELAVAVQLVKIEPGVHRDFPAKVSSSLLWLAGSEASETKANDSWALSRFEYEKDYLSRPAQSFFILENRHAALAMSDGEVSLLSRLKRTIRYWPSPKMTAPKSFLDELTDVAAKFDVNELDTGMSSTLVDHNFSELKHGLARFLPAQLAALTRRRLANLAERSDEGRHWAGLRAPDHILLIEEEAAHAAGTVRRKKPSTESRDEAFVAARLMHLELLPMSAVQQLDTLADAGDVPILRTFENVLKAAEMATIVDFVERWGVTHKRAVEVLFNYLAKHSISLPLSLLEQLSDIALDEGSGAFRNVAFIGLSNSNPNEFGLILLQRGWRYSPGLSTFEQIYGSVAICAATTTQPLEAISDVVAPWALLKEACDRGGSRKDIKVAAQALDLSIEATRNLEIGALDTDVLVDVTEEHGLISFGDLKVAADADGPELFADAFNFEKQRIGRETAQGNTLLQLERVRTAGATMYTLVLPVEHALALVTWASAEVDSWLDGLESRTPEFVNRANLAGGLFIAICEALLATAPERGVLLWQFLFDDMRMKFVGLANASELVHILFRVPYSAPVDRLRNEIYTLRCNPTKFDYTETVLCAIANDGRSWLLDRVKADESSGEDWRKKRAIMIRGLIDDVELDDVEWFEGPPEGGWTQIRRDASSSRNRRAFARFWWNSFIQAADVEAAYAAWQVLLVCADRHVWIWVERDLSKLDLSDALSRIKLLHLELSRSALERAISDAEARNTPKMKDELMSWKSPVPWINLSSIVE